MGETELGRTPQRTERAGVPVWWVDAPGEFFCSLMFRVGLADETLATNGITHLAEHLALFGLGRRDHPFNGFVDDQRCVFYASGERAEVLEFIRLVAASLDELPLDRLGVERRVLRAEASSAGGLYARLRGHRFGAAGFGLVNYRELGLRWLGPDEVTAWAGRHFTRGNAVVWMTGEPPDDLDLALPAGERVPTPVPAPLAVQHPAFLAEGTGGAVLSGIGPRSTPLRAACDAAAERLYDHLRRDRGMAYAPYADYATLGAGLAHVALGSDCSDVDAPVVLEEIWRIARELAEGGATEEELERYRRGSLRSFQLDEAIRGRLDVRATDDLLGAEPFMEERWLRELDELTGEQAAEAFREVMGTALLIGPDGTKAPAPGFCPATPAQPPGVEGEPFVPVQGGGSGEALTAGDRGVTYRSRDGVPVTIEWERCAAAERRPDGSLMLHAHDGGWLTITPSHWERGEELLARILAALDPHLVIPAADAEVAALIESLAAEKLEAPQRVGHALATLTSELKAGEDLVDLAEGVSEKAPGLLAVTDRRVLWLTGSGGRELQLREIGRVKLPRSKLLGGPLGIGDDGGMLWIDIGPRSRAREIGAEIERRAGEPVRDVP